jgi:hypothetical protein
MAKVFYVLFAAIFIGYGIAFCSQTSVPSIQCLLSCHEPVGISQNLPLAKILSSKISDSPFSLIATTIFILAIIHTFFAPMIAKHAKVLNERFFSNPANGVKICLSAEICHFLGEVEVIFGIWCVPLIAAIAYNFGWSGVTYYFGHGVSFAEPVFVVVIMSIASTKPVITLAESILRRIAMIGHCTIGAWWLTILIVSPLMGSLITEPAAMTIGATLLAKKFYKFSPPNFLKYLTLGLLFTNISVGGTLSHFAAPPVLMVAGKWSIGLCDMFLRFGVRAIIGISVSTTVYFLALRKHFAKMARQDLDGDGVVKVPFCMAAVHIAFMVWTVVNIHTPVLVMAGYASFIVFVRMTRDYQSELRVKNALLVGFFLAGLVIHGGFQTWWLSPVLSSLGEFQLFIGATILTAFNDNASITYLASLVPTFLANAPLQKAVLAGAVTGGGLTVIANAPNPTGQSILSEYFPDGISPIKLLLGAIIPTIIIGTCFMVC